MISSVADTNNDFIYRSETFQSFFKNSPRSLLIKADPPFYTVIAVSDNYLMLTHRKRNEVLNKPLFEVYPGNHEDLLEQQTVINSFQTVINTGKVDVLPMFRYEIQVEESGEMQSFFWSNTNEPLLDENGKVGFIINTTANITEQVVLNNELASSKAKSEQLILEQNILQRINTELERRVDSRTKALSESEARAKYMLADAPVGIAVFKSPELWIESANKKILNYWGKTEEVINKRLIEVMPEIFDQGFTEIFNQVFSNEAPFYGKEVKVVVNINGQMVINYFDFVYQPLKDAYGKTDRIMAVAISVTEQVEARKRLEQIIEEKSVLENDLLENQQRLQSILDTMAEGVGIIDSSGKMVYANQMAQRILGLSESEIIARTYHDPNWINLKVDGTILPEEEHPMAIMMRTGIPIYDQEIAVQPPNKDKFYISINAAPIKDKNGQVTGGIGTFMDVTNRRIMMQQKDEFISVASHELKTPITSLKASLQLLDRLKDRKGADLNKLIEQSNRSLTKLNHLVVDLLDVSRITQGQLLLRKSLFPVADLIQDCFNHMADTGKHKIIVKGDIEISLYADEQQIDQVLVNFVNNAVKYAPESPEILISIQELEETIKISVKDTGPGIPQHKIPFVFDKYYRVDHSDKHTSGLGLGLYICAEIIHKHGGEIGVDSIAGNGTSFWFSLPKDTSSIQ